MIITIKGKQGSGKTNLARKICKGKNFLYINESFLNSTWWTHEIDKKIDFIIVDEVKNYKKTYSIFTDKFLIVNRQCKKTFTIKMPKIILIC